jgi:hypothetical protein
MSGAGARVRREAGPGREREKALEGEEAQESIGRRGRDPSIMTQRTSRRSKASERRLAPTLHGRPCGHVRISEAGRALGPGAELRRRIGSGARLVEPRTGSRWSRQDQVVTERSSREGRRGSAGNGRRRLGREAAGSLDGRGSVTAQPHGSNDPERGAAFWQGKALKGKSQSESGTKQGREARGRRKPSRG